MSRKCVVCKIEASPGCDRSFHHFPKDESMRRQWIEALKLKSEINFKTNYVCSIHVNEKCFTDRIEYNRRRLLAGSVPGLECNTKIQTVALDIDKDEAHVQTILDSTSCMEINCNEYRGEISNIDESNDDNISTANIENEDRPSKNVSNTTVICDIANTNKRKNSPEDNSVLKKVKFTHCNKVKSLSRSDFVSDEGWEKCLQLKKYFLLKLNAAQSRICKKEKKVRTLTALITHQLKQEEFHAADLKKKVDTFILYFENLKIFQKEKKNKVNIAVNNCDSRILLKVTEYPAVCTGFVGLIICLTNLFNLAKDLFENKYIDYLLSYKLSQDHLEMFFSIIRRINGFNNNPTTVQYLSAIKKILCNKLNVSVPVTANCTPLDSTFLINIDSDKSPDEILPEATKEIKSTRILLENTTENVNYNEQVLHNSSFSDTNYCKPPPHDHDYCNYDFQWYGNEYSNQIISYIAGYIVRHLKRNIHCDKCLSIIDSSKSNKDSTLIMLKNRGALNFACDSLIIICKCTERVIRESPNLFAKDISLKIINGTMRRLPSNLFNDDHFFDQELLMDHRNQLILLVIKTYINVRLCHESRLINDNTNRIRMKNNKITIFSGQ